jgi:hypothetical protein
MKRALALLICCAIPLACQTAGKPGGMQLLGDEGAMKQEVLRFVPLDTPADKARTLMQAQGWQYLGDGTRPGDQGMAFVIRDPQIQLRFWDNQFMAKLIQVTLDCEGGKVKDVHVSYKEDDV